MSGWLEGPTDSPAGSWKRDWALSVAVRKPGSGTYLFWARESGRAAVATTVGARGAGRRGQLTLSVVGRRAGELEGWVPARRRTTLSEHDGQRNDTHPLAEGNMPIVPPVSARMRCTEPISLASRAARTSSKSSGTDKE
jgi:hypothetical protein